MYSGKCALALLALALVVSCDDDDDILSPQNAAVLQFVNAGTSGTVFGTSSSTAIGSSLATGSASSSCALVTPGTTLGFSENGAAVTSSTAATVAGQRYTAVLYGSGAGRAMILVPEVMPTVTAGSYGLRIINATNQTGNIFVTTPTGAATGTATTVLTSGTATGGSTGIGGFMVTPEASTRIRFFGTASTTTPLGDFTVTNPSSTAPTTVVFANNSTGGVVAFAFPQCTL